jgi:hypothetical protein
MPVEFSGVYDIETESWDRFVVGGVLTASGYAAYRDPDLMADAMLDAAPATLWAHNGGKFDALWFLDIIRRRGLTARVSLAGSRVTRVQCGGLVLCDSYALIPMALRKCAPMGGESKGHPDLPCVCGDDCGGYCSIRRDMPESRYRKVESYLEQDCRSLLAVLRALEATAARERIVLRGTVGGTAWATASHELALPAARWPRGDYALSRNGYYGGRVEVFRPGTEIAPLSGHRYDIHSSYPAALVRTPVPTGQGHVVAHEAGRRYRAGREGIFRAVVDVPEMHVPPLPLRVRDRIAFPVGRFEGEWSAVELRAAEAVGARIKRIRWGIAWDESAAVLAPWCERFWTLRAGHLATPGPEAAAWAAWYKWFCNSLTGKLGQSPDMRSIMVTTEAPRACDGGSRPCDGTHHPAKCCSHRCVGTCGKWDILSYDGRVWSRPFFKIASCAYVHWSAYLTASARVELGEQLRHAGEDAIYCDTDSVYSLRPLDRRLGDGLGEWGYEGAMTDWFCVAPKVYRYRDGTGTWQARAKGIPAATAATVDAFGRGEKVAISRGVRSFLSAARSPVGSLFQRASLSRGSHADGRTFGSRVLGDDDMTHPVDAKELAV